MDPDATLDALRAAIAEADDAPFGFSSSVLLGAAVDIMRDLDEWLTKGGYLPRAWEQPKPEGRHGS